jgi:hypothetical protein
LSSILNTAIKESLLHFWKRPSAITEHLGYDGMLAAPIEADGDFALKYRGTPGMYEKFGYELIEKMDRLSVYWLDFHKVDQ